MPAPAQLIPTKIHGGAVLARSTRDVVDAWNASTTPVRTVTVAAALSALCCAATAEVPLASGLTVAVMIAAALVDLHTRRLPDGIVIAASVVFGVASLAAVATGTGFSAASVALGAVAFAGPLLVVHLIAPTSMGFGDVKSAAVLGLAIGAVDWGLAPWALALAAGTTALAGIAQRRSTLPLGPGLVSGALSAIVAVAVFGLEGIGL